MARITNDDKYMRTLKLLMSVHNPRVVTLLRLRGFEQEDLEEGWELFKSATGQFSSIDNMKNMSNQVNINELIGEIDDWENTWYEVANAALTRSFPEIQKELFLNLNKESGISVIANVRTMVNRFDTIFHNTEETYVNATKLLNSRGLNDEILEEARTLLAKAEGASFEELPQTLVTKETLDIARDKMWAWYIDWSVTARTIITSKQMKISMGLSTPTKTKTEE
jgi:hypothetical protein